MTKARKEFGFWLIIWDSVQNNSQVLKKAEFILIIWDTVQNNSQVCKKKEEIIIYVKKAELFRTMSKIIAKFVKRKRKL